MKARTRLLILFVFLLLVALPTTAYARGLDQDKVVFGGNYTLVSGQTLDGSLLVFGGNATLEVGSTVDRDVIIMGGNLEVNGLVKGNIASFGGNTRLTSTAEVDGNVSMIGSQLQQDPAAKVHGSVNTNVNGPFSFNFPGWRGIEPGISLPGLSYRLDPFFNIMWYLLKSFFWAVLAVLVVLFVPRSAERTAHTAVHQPLLAGGLGLLTIIVLPAVLVLLAITICLLPVSLIAAVLLAIAWAFGLVSIGLEVGKRLAVIAKQEWALAVEAALGTFLLVLVLDGVGFIPCVGWILKALVGMLGLGAVLLTRFGTQDYPIVLPGQMVTPPTPLVEAPPVQEQPGNEPGSSEGPTEPPQAS